MAFDGHIMAYYGLLWKILLWLIMALLSRIFGRILIFGITAPQIFPRDHAESFSTTY
jgi:hypothetical protein